MLIFLYFASKFAKLDKKIFTNFAYLLETIEKTSVKFNIYIWAYQKNELISQES